MEEEKAAGGGGEASRARPARKAHLGGDDAVKGVEELRLVTARARVRRALIVAEQRPRRDCL